MSVVISPNMNLPVPVVGQEPSPTWATDVNNCFAGVDSHDHSPGKGVQITPAGLNINSDLSFLNNNAIALRTARFQANPVIGVTDLKAVYVNGVDLYYVDGNGNQVRLTQAGSVAGTSGSIANLIPPASATYVGGTGTFVWQSAANTPANLDAGFIILRNNVANSKGLTLSPPAAMGADYSVTLPALPGATNFVTMDVSGNLAATANVDNSTLQFSVNTLSVKNLGINTAHLANGGVTNAKLAALNIVTSGSSGSFSVNALSAITNMNINLTTIGRPVFIGFKSDGLAVAGAYIKMLNNAGNVSGGLIIIQRNGTDILRYAIGSGVNAPGTNILFTTIPSSSVMFIDTAAPAGVNNYVAYASPNTGNDFLSVFNSVLVAYEI